jgi:hypothetical protein
MFRETFFPLAIHTINWMQVSAHPDRVTKSHVAGGCPNW